MANKKHTNTVGAVTELVTPIVEKMGLSLWDVRFEKEGAMRYLRIFIDKPDGVTIDDCESVTRAIDKPLDELDPIEENYCLEVSSPGVERELVKDEHFEEFLGAPVKVKLIRPDADGEREYNGALVSNQKDCVTIALENGERKEIRKKDTVYIKLDDFNI